MTTLHVLPDIEQRSEEWFDQRRGMVTASMVGKLLSTDAPEAQSVACPDCHVEAGPCLSLARKTPTLLKTVHSARTALAAGQPPVIRVADNDTSRGLTAALVAERITGICEPSFVSEDMWRGIEHEPYARDIYSGHYAEAVEVGFMRLDGDGWSLGYSPDGLVGEDGLIEIKCPRAKGHVNTILADEVPTYYMAQLQAALLVSGRKWCDYVSFHAGLPLFVKRVTPDPAWHEAITAAVTKFETTAAEMVAAYTEATKTLPATERIDMEITI